MGVLHEFEVWSKFYRRNYYIVCNIGYIVSRYIESLEYYEMPSKLMIWLSCLSMRITFSNLEPDTIVAFNYIKPYICNQEDISEGLT